MASPAMAMERPPVPPDVQAQVGPPGGGDAPPFAGVGGLMADKQAAGDPLKKAIDLTEQLWNNASKGNPKLQPYVARALAILKAGMEDVAKGTPGPGGPGGPSENGGAAPPPPGPPPGQMPG
jgi:hypothetical protein